MNTPYVLFSTATPFSPAGDPVEQGGVKRQRFRKDLIHAGTYKHPKDGWTLHVTPERMDKWVASFRAMKSNGRGVEVVKDHSFKADDKVGEVVDMHRDGDTLYAVHEFIGDDSIALAQRVGTVSPWIEPDYRDGRTEYGEAIVHSSIVQQPVVDSQKPFEAIAASLEGTRAALLNLSPQKSPTPGAMKMDLKELRSILGMGDELTEENATKMIQDRLSKAETTKTEAERKAQEAETEKLRLESQLKEAKAKAGKPEPDADSLEMQAEVAGERIDALVEQGRVTPAVAASLKTLFIGEQGARNAYALSATYSGRKVSLVREVIDALKQNDPVELGERTRSQSRALSFADLDDDKRTEATKHATEQLRAGAGLNAASA